MKLFNRKGTGFVLSPMQQLILALVVLVIIIVLVATFTGKSGDVVNTISFR